MTTFRSSMHSFLVVAQIRDDDPTGHEPLGASNLIEPRATWCQSRSVSMVAMPWLVRGENLGEPPE
jgi:hypothetical protein